ncbi:hypothetical protein HPP92_025461 [Vanilla planifolia]|uniref:Uncharacterized protein n=1 Tax=Vanilla planifolia TaxID=51239 RepID=A0A835PMC6_VANPL|nr:hypothetical protein HPP92_025461 [Vanilla planifolia]
MVLYYLSIDRAKIERKKRKDERQRETRTNDSKFNGGDTKDAISTRLEQILQKTRDYIDAYSARIWCRDYDTFERTREGATKESCRSGFVEPNIDPPTKTCPWQVEARGFLVSSLESWHEREEKKEWGKNRDLEHVEEKRGGKKELSIPIKGPITAYYDLENHVRLSRHFLIYTLRFKVWSGSSSEVLHAIFIAASHGRHQLILELYSIGYLEKQSHKKMDYARLHNRVSMKTKESQSLSIDGTGNGMIEADRLKAQAKVEGTSKTGRRDLQSCRASQKIAMVGEVQRLLR